MTVPRIATQVMLAIIFAHELDAMTHSEWRLLYLLRDLSDEQGRWWFVVIHIPLFWALIALTQAESAGIKVASRVGFSLFCIIHALLHWRMANDPTYTFVSPLSWSLILGAAGLGVACLIADARATNARRV